MKKILSLLILTLIITSSLGISFADATVIENDLAVTITTVRDSTKILSSKVIDTNYQTRSEWHEETFEYLGIRHTHEILKVANINAGTVDMRALFTFKEKWYVDDHDTKVKFI